MKRKKRGSKLLAVFNIILIIFAVVVIKEIWHEYEINNFSDFVKAEYNIGTSSFIRDDVVKYSNKYSYKIESNQFNDALIYKTIEVEENTVYKVTAMAKFENVVNENDETEGGVNIGIMDTTEKSDSLVGTGEWQKISFEFDSKNRTQVDIAFRLGSYDDNSKGTVWFSDFTLEKGQKDTGKNWNFICFIMKNIETDIIENGYTKRVKQSLKSNEVGYIEKNMKRFQDSMKELSGGKMTVTYKTVVIDEPITSITDSEEYGYYVTALDVKEMLKQYMLEDEYDHVFVAYKLGEELHEEQINTGDWIGLRWNDIRKRYWLFKY